MSLPVGGVLPDVQHAVLAHLTADTDVTAITQNIGHRVTDPWPCLRAVRIGGTPIDPRRLDEGLIQLEAWGEPADDNSATVSALHNLLGIAVASLVWRLKATTVAGCHVSRVDVITHAQWAPDARNDQPRYLSRLLITARPA